MADTVQYHLENMIPELEDLEKKKIFSKEEIRSIVKKRTNFEYSLKRRSPKKIDYLRYIEYELNLENLRKKRKLRLDIGGKPSVSDYAGPRRINFIFERALVKFKGDVALWLQWVDFAKKNKMNKLLSKIFARAIQLHPAKPSLWILAASWEFEDNLNTTAARILLQRGLRLNPESQELWLEYFRLELVYMAKIRERRRILGILKKKQPKSETVEEKKEEDMIVLPTLDEEEEMEPKREITISDGLIQTLKAENNAFLSGAVALIVYQNAIKSISDDLDFRQKFLEVYQTIPETEAGQEAVYESIKSDFPHNESARALYIEKSLAGVDPNSVEYVNGVKKCTQGFSEVLQELGTGTMWEKYCGFLKRCHGRVSEENLKTYFVKALSKAFDTAFEKGVMTENLYVSWLEHLQSSQQFDEAIQAAGKAVTQFPKRPELWLIYAELVIHSDNSDDVRSKISDIYTKALSHNSTHQTLWVSYFQWLTKEWKDDMISSEEVDSKYMDAIKAVQSLTSEYLEVKEYVQSEYIKWVKECGGITKCREVYMGLSKQLPLTAEFFKQCIELEESTASKSSPETQKHLQWLFEQAIQVNDKDDQIWIAYLDHLLSTSQFDKATHIHWKAQHVVSNKDRFERDYFQLIGGANV
ncbi:U3 snoRNP protein [Basidiobolus ranarum]|uniref:U3 snoRNP protein n=1 Tax=Basidiobolus ranarum TaxID=34480 RepID=A0ABR2W8R6_9FUNG